MHFFPQILSTACYLSALHNSLLPGKSNAEHVYIFDFYRFWIACQDLKKMTFSQVPAKVQQIYRYVHHSTVTLQS